MDLECCEGPGGRRTEVDCMVPCLHTGLSAPRSKGSVGWTPCCQGLKQPTRNQSQWPNTAGPLMLGLREWVGWKGWAVLHREGDTAKGQVSGESCARAWDQVWDTLVGCSITHCMSSAAHSQRHWPFCHNVLPHASPTPLFSLLGLDLAPTHWENAQSIPQDACTEKHLFLGCPSYEIFLS